VADKMQVQLVSRGKPQGAAYLCWDDQSPLLAQHDCGIHESRMPLLIISCHNGSCGTSTAHTPAASQRRGACHSADFFNTDTSHARASLELLRPLDADVVLPGLTPAFHGIPNQAVDLALQHK
jgi:hypothetical protein